MSAYPIRHYQLAATTRPPIFEMPPRLPDSIPTAHRRGSAEHSQQNEAKHARMLGANAIIAVRYDATDVMMGLSELLCYGTAVEVVPVPVRL